MLLSSHSFLNLNVFTDINRENRLTTWINTQNLFYWTHILHSFGFNIFFLLALTHHFRDVEVGGSTPWCRAPWGCRADSAGDCGKFSAELVQASVAYSFIYMKWKERPLLEREANSRLWIFFLFSLSLSFPLSLSRSLSLCLSLSLSPHSNYQVHIFGWYIPLPMKSLVLFEEAASSFAIDRSMLDLALVSWKSEHYSFNSVSLLIFLFIYLLKILWHS